MKAKKQIKKLKSELSEQDRRIKKIEMELERNSSFTLSKDVLRSITEPKLSVEEQPFVLPEKWCVRTDKQEVVDYCDKNGAIPPYKVDSDLYAHFPAFSERSFTTAGEIQKGYTEITFEQFKQHILKEDDLTTIMLESPKPVESDTFKNLKLEDIQVNVEDCSEEEIKDLADIFVANGFKLWKYSFALGVNNGKKFLSSLNSLGKYGVFVSQGKTTLTPSQFREMFGKKEIDWSKAGQLVENKDGYKWITTGNHEDVNCFEAVLIGKPESDTTQSIGRISTACRKKAFTLCTEPITLNN